MVRHALYDFLFQLLQSEDQIFMNESNLARFCLALLSVKGRMLSDDSIQTSVLLVDCTLDDTRPGRGAKITRWFWIWLYLVNILTPRAILGFQSLSHTDSFIIINAEVIGCLLVTQSPHNYWNDFDEIVKLRLWPGFSYFLSWYNSGEAACSNASDSLSWRLNLNGDLWLDSWTSIWRDHLSFIEYRETFI